MRQGQLEPAGTAAENVTFAHWILNLISGVLDSFSSERDELLRFREMVLYFLDQPDVYPFTTAQKVTGYMVLARVEWELGSPRAADYLEKCLDCSKNITSSQEARISVLRFAAVVYYSLNRKEQALSVVCEALSCVTAAWQKATAYLNDHRVCQLLAFIQRSIDMCYSIMRTSAGSRELYESVLRFKDLPSLVGRERNRLLRSAPVDDGLRSQIFALQDQLAAAELNDSRQGTNTAQDIAARLQRLEAAFASKFPQNMHFTPITFDRVCEKLPEDSAIIEYYFVPGEAALSGKPCDEAVWELDIFVTAKHRGQSRLNRLQIQRGDVILRQAAEFIDILQNSDDISRSGTKASLRGQLYRKLIAPVLPFLDGITNVYIAPDSELCNLPFEILRAEGYGLLQDQFRICRLVCGRDLLFYDDHVSPGGSSFILGDPNYEAQQGERTDSPRRGSQMRLTPVSALPFSGIEAQRISRRCRTRACSGNEATKYALQHALPCNVIHLATHGVFDDTPETDSLYSSHLVFAGYNKWAAGQGESQYCGNGILTVDEISRMDLQETELVVLSACQSGLGDTTYGSTRGLLSAFSAAGARWIVSHMWEASDFATPILMDAFYDAYLNMGREVPGALQYAKEYLRTVTVGTLRRDGWFRLPADTRISEDVRGAVAEMNQWPDSTVPFADEFFWGGFIVHKSR